MSKKYMIGNTHFDPVWLWTWDEAMASIRATFRSALERMKEYPDFTYSFATPPVFEWIRQTDPEMFEEIKARVAEGRWELGEGWWLQPDCYSASGESYVRQGLYGQRWLKEAFGRYADSVFNIDSFGHSPMLPQILKKSHVRYYTFVRPEARHIPMESPLFYWESPDGSRLLTCRADDCYNKDTAGRLSRAPEDRDELIVYGVTDHGGAPTKAAIEAIHRDPDAFCSTLTRYFSDHADCTEVRRGELLTGDFGVYANLNRIKQLVRIGEYSLLNAEKAAFMTGSDDRAMLTAGWKDVLFNQFHDIIGGACIKDAYEDAYNQLGRAIFSAKEQTHFHLQQLTRMIKMPGDVWNLVVWNLNPAPFSDYIEAEVQWAHEFDWYEKGIELEDAMGNRIPCQVIREKSVIPRFRSRFVFKAEIPALGCRIFRVVQNEQEIEKPGRKPLLERVIRTGALNVTLNEQGVIESVCAPDGKRLCGRLFAPAAYTDDGDTWCFNIKAYDETPIPFETLAVEQKESGPIRTVIRSAFRLGMSTLTLWYTFYADDPIIDLRWQCHFNDRRKAIKLECDAAPEHLAAVPYGTIKRGETAADVPLGAWLQAKDGCRYTLYSDATCAYNNRNGRIGLTLLRSPIYGDLRISPIDTEDDYDIVSQGLTEGRMRIRFGDSSEKQAFEEADSFANRPIVIDEAWHDGETVISRSYASIDSDSVRIAAIKPCEDGDGWILRLQECAGKASGAVIRLGGRVIEASLSAYEIQTLKIGDDGLTRTVSMIED